MKTYGGMETAPRILTLPLDGTDKLHDPAALPPHPLDRRMRHPTAGLNAEAKKNPFPAPAGTSHATNAISNSALPTFPLRQRVQTDSGSHPTFYPMGTGSSLPGRKAAGA
jgi:hypothetical protein